jgi:hypothetical protein
MRQDPRVIRWTILKLGDTVEKVAYEGARELSLKGKALKLSNQVTGTG